MLRSLYSGIAGMRGFQTKLDTIGNNIANVNTTGFKSGRVMFKDVMSQMVQGAGAPGNGMGGTNAIQVGLGSTISAIDTMMTDGSTQMTNRPLDFAIQGNGFFTVQNDNGDTYYTRAGNFYFDSTGDLVNSDGWKVMGADGSVINIGDMTQVKSFSFDSKGMLTIAKADGSTDTKGPVGLTVFANPSGLEKAGGSLFRATSNSGPANAPVPPGDASTGSGILQVGALEMSNVDLTNEFAEMIVAQRGFQANARTITTADQILQEVVDLKH